MKLSDFDYTLPPDRIAQFPPAQRTASRMLVINRSDGTLNDNRFSRLPDILGSSHFLVLNDSRVFKARLMGRRASGGAVEVFLVRRIEGTRWKVLLQPSGRIQQEEEVIFDDTLKITISDAPGGTDREAAFASPFEEKQIIARFGTVPLPPYIKREADERDERRYQTVYAAAEGSVAAPTAGLHFDRPMLSLLTAHGISCEKITLHVGPGTFKPVQVEEIEQHEIDPEFAEVTPRTADAINRRKKNGGKLLAIGTTTVRTLESAADSGGRIQPYSGMIDLFVYPPYEFKAVDAMLTNFHLPKSSLLMLVAAFCGRDLLFEAYQHAIESEYRFYSYGDCMLIL